MKAETMSTLREILRYARARKKYGIGILMVLCMCSNDARG